MTSLTALFTKKRVSIANQNNPLREVIEFDASVEEGHTGTSELTDHPVESGADITDHVRRNPEELTINGIVSEHPIVLLASLRAPPSIAGGDPGTRVADAYGLLKQFKDEGTLLQVSTTLRDYANMVITSVDVRRSAETGRMLNVNLTLRELLIATTATVDPPEPVEPTRKRKANRGKKPKTSITSAVESKVADTKSLATDFFGEIGSLLGG